MECNKDEALRAIGIAENKLRVKDYLGAQKMTLKAKRLFPDLENIPQILSVCDVHCAAANKVQGSQLDWYRILQVEPTADESTIKKQYRKLALILHPDKNKLSGAEYAFKLIREAVGILSDQAQRALYDMKRRPAMVRTKLSDTQSPAPPDFCSSTRKAEKVNELKKKATMEQQNLSNDSKKRRKIVKSGKAEKVNELKKKATMEQQNLSNDSKKRRKIVKSESSYSESSDGQDSIGSDMDEQFADKPSTCASSDRPLRFFRIRQRVNYNEDKIDEDDDFVSIPRSSRPNIIRTSGGDPMNEMDSTQHGGNTDGTPEVNPPLNQKINKQKLDHSRQENKFETERVEIDDAGQDGIDRVQHTQHESPDESDEDCNSQLQPEFIELPDSEFHDFDSDKRGACFSVDQVWAVYDLHALPRYYAVIRKVLSTDFKLRITWLEALPGCTEEESWVDAELPVACGGYILGETEVTEDRLMFSHLMKFERGHGKMKYKIYPKKGEIWALYKDWDINWFSNLQGHFHFEYEMVELLMDYSDDTGADVVSLVKLKGFQCLYVRMTKEGHEATFHVRGGQSYRFSHQVPAYSMKGNEGEGIPLGSFELDTAGFPVNFKDSVPLGTSKEGEVQLAGSQCQGASSSKPINISAVSQEIMKGECEEKKVKEGEEIECNELGWHPTSNIMDKKPEQIYGNKLCEDETMRTSEDYAFESPECSSRVSIRDSVSVSTSKHLSVSGVNDNGISVCRQNGIILSGVSDHLKKLPAPEFCDFMDGRTINKFQKNQIWAVFDNLDNMPRFYAWIKGIDHSAKKVHIIWLEICHEDLLTEEVMWLARKLPVACGVFKAKDCDCVSPEWFSHQIRDEPSWTEGKFGIYPRQGEVWAIYNRWSYAWTKSDHTSHKCSIVEVVSTYSAEKGVRVRHLTRIKGHHYIFQNSQKPESNISRACLLQFSHQVPAFKLQGKAGSGLKGCWELDPASLPKDLFTCLFNAT